MASQIKNQPPFLPSYQKEQPQKTLRNRVNKTARIEMENLKKNQKPQGNPTLTKDPSDSDEEIQKETSPLLQKEKITVKEVCSSSLTCIFPTACIFPSRTLFGPGGPFPY